MPSSVTERPRPSRRRLTPLSAADLVYLNNRHYSATTGVFTSVDPLVEKTKQPYLYGAANPVTLDDPEGLDPDTRADVRAEVERRGGCTYSSTDAACQGRARVHAPTQWTPRRTTKAYTWGPDGKYYTKDTVFFDPPVEQDPSSWRPAGNPHRERTLRNGKYYIGGYLDSNQEHDLRGTVEPLAGLGIGLTVCPGICFKGGIHQGRTYFSIGELGLGASVDGTISSQSDPCAQQGFSQGGSLVVGAGGGGSVATPLPEGSGWWTVDGDNFNVTGSIGLVGKGPVGGTAFTWVSGC